MGARLRADGGRGRDPLSVAGDILRRASAAGRPITLHERATIRQHVREYEQQAGETLLACAERLMHSGDGAACARLLDLDNVLHG